MSRGLTGVVLVLLISVMWRIRSLASGIVTGIWTGLVATVALEAVRIIGRRVLGSMPRDLPQLIGVLLTDRPERLMMVFGEALVGHCNAPLMPEERRRLCQALCIVTAGDQACPLEDLDVLGDRRLADGERRGQLRHRRRT